MSCRRAYEIDLPAFVIDPHDPAWDDFRAHYPSCAACAAEVATWTTLQASLVGRHPEPADLLRWHDAADTVAAERRAEIGSHVARCASCRDELRALDGHVAASVASAQAGDATSRAGDAVGGDDDAPPHHASASRAGGRHAERHAFARAGSGRSAAHGAATGDRRGTADRRGPVARVLLHPAFAYAVLAIVLLLPTVRAALDRDAGRTTFDVAATRAPETAPPQPKPITQGSAQAEREVAATHEDVDAKDVLTDRAARGPAEASVGRAPGRPADATVDRTSGEPAGAPTDDGAQLPDDAHVDRTAPRLMRQAPFRAAPPPPAAAGVPAAPAQDGTAPAPAAGSQGGAAPAAPAGLAAAPAAKAVAPLAEEDRAAHRERAREALPQEAAAVAGSSTRAAGAPAAAPGRSPGNAAPLPPIRLLPTASGAGHILVVSLPASAAGAADLELRVVDPRGGRELRQHVARAAGPGSDLQVTLPAGFTAAVLQVEVYADGAGPVLQGSVTP